MQRVFREVLLALHTNRNTKILNVCIKNRGVQIQTGLPAILQSHLKFQIGFAPKLVEIRT